MANVIIFLTTRGHAYTVEEFSQKAYAAEMPAVRAMSYEQAFWAKRLPRATYIFTDLERLYPWELRCAADLYQRLQQAGQRCLNDPARVMTRYELLRALHRAGINPFTIYRAEDEPRPARFPVFIRLEFAHDLPLSGLLADADELRTALTGLVAQGWARRLLLVVEFCAAPVAENIWCKHGSIRIGDEIHLDRYVMEDNWIAKNGTKGIWTEAMFQDESEAIAEKRYAEAVRPAFEIAGIEWGRADHATVGGREVVYEINTNPHVTRGNKQKSAVRDAALALSARHARDGLRLIDSGGDGAIRMAPGGCLPGRGRGLGWRWVHRA